MLFIILLGAHTKEDLHRLLMLRTSLTFSMHSSGKTQMQDREIQLIHFSVNEDGTLRVSRCSLSFVIQTHTNSSNFLVNSVLMNGPTMTKRSMV